MAVLACDMCLAMVSTADSESEIRVRISVGPLLAVLVAHIVRNCTRARTWVDPGWDSLCKNAQHLHSVFLPGGSHMGRGAGRKLVMGERVEPAEHPVRLPLSS